MARKGLNIYKRKDGRWEGRIVYGTKSNGAKKYKSFYGKSYTEVRERLKKEMSVTHEFDTPLHLKIEDILYCWLREKKFYWKESTYACYKQIIERQILPDLGQLSAGNFGTIQLETYLSEKLNHGNKNSGKGLSDVYVRSICGIILQAFKYMNHKYQYHHQILSFSIPKVWKPETKLPHIQDIQKLEQYLKNNLADPTALGILLCMYTGLRIGELCALQWKDINFENGVLSVTKTVQRIKKYGAVKQTEIIISPPKSRKSCRTIPIPQQLLIHLKKYQDVPEKHLILGKKVAFAEPRTLQYRFASILKKCQLEQFHFHMLRHLFATRCIHAGFDTKTLSELLGHSNIKITLGLYVHSSEDRKRELMNQLFIDAA